jgi:hypothetical protein
MTKELTKFEQLCEQDVSKYTEKKNGLTYLSWTYAWKEFKKNYPQATYHVTHWDGAPYYYDENLGYMCETTVDNGDGTVHSMWLPVMDGANKAMKAQMYTYETRNGKKAVQPATMFDINTTIMRCLVKNIAMFGLGLYIYSGEDLPELSEITIEKNNQARVEEMKKRIRAMIDKLPPEIDTTEFTGWEKSDDVEKLKAFGIYLKKLLG